jgi:lipopolysaccharide export system permease protein
MGLLSSYLMRSILTSTLLVLLVLLSLAGLFEFISQLEDTRGNYGTPQALLFTFLRLPQLAFEMLPIAVLIGSLLGLGGLANNSELVGSVNSSGRRWTISRGRCVTKEDTNRKTGISAAPPG